jgi:hypothetical protein
MITLQQLEEFFAATREIHEEGRASWRIDETCRWSYFFVDASEEKLLPVADHMEALGYEVAGMLEPAEGDEDPVYYLRVDRVEQHSPESLHERNTELYRIARQFEIAGYDGMDVGDPAGA